MAPEIVESGGYADIIAVGDGRVLKAFRRKNHGGNRVTDWADHDAVTRAIFRAEARAYKRLQHFPDLAVYAPRFHGLCDPAQFQWSGVDYVPGCGLLLERIPGRARKLAHLESYEEVPVSRIVEEFRDQLGIDNVWDASCFIPGSRAPFTVVDFAYWDAGEYEMALGATGVLSATLRDKLEKQNAD